MLVDLFGFARSGDIEGYSANDFGLYALFVKGRHACLSLTSLCHNFALRPVRVILCEVRQLEMKGFVWNELGSSSFD